MDELLAQFLIEGRDLVAEAHGALAAGDYDRLFRAVHTLKGSVALFDMAPAEALLHAAETVLATYRTGTAPVALAAIEAVIDQTDRWIDAMEQVGALPADARTIADQGIARLGIAEAPAAADWTQAALALPPIAPHAADGGTLFRYAPDAECFFRGDDPLAIAAAVPGLVALSLRLTEAGEITDPFRCITVLEGLSSADEAAVHAAFRLVSDQVRIATVAPQREAEEQQAAATATLRVDAARLDALALQTGELAIAVNALADLAERAATLDRTLAADIRRAHGQIERALAQVRDGVAGVRLVPLEPVLRRLPRLARELAAALDKPLRFTMTGEATAVDKQIADALFEPLLHLLRNAIDHGLEPDRRAAGKPAQGEITLAIAPQGEQVLVTLTDDGAGIDPARMRASALAKGLIDRADTISDAQALRLMFLPGFSTAEAVTAVSGRGVGMDAVQQAVQRLQGTIEVDSVPGQYTRITLRLPLNAITTRLLTVSAGGATYGLRLDQIAETLRIEAGAIVPLGHGLACVIRDRTVPVLDLAQRLGGAPSPDPIARLVVSEAGGERVAIRVDALGRRIDAMVREGGGVLAALPAIGGTTVLADGTVLLVLDLAELTA
jgi:two-component system, chemotaxis family, sensor kinase CheA